MAHLFILLSTFFSLLFSQIGILDTKAGIWVKHFTTKPGLYGKPGTNVFTVHGKIPVYELFDWSLLDVKLTNQSTHRWYRVSTNYNYWVYQLPNFTFTKGETNK